MRFDSPALPIALAAGLLSACASVPTQQELASMPGPHSDMSAQATLVDGRARFRDVFCGVLARQEGRDDRVPDCPGWLWKLGDEPAAAPRPLPQADRTVQVYLVSGAFSECLGEDARPFNRAAVSLARAGYRIATIVVSGRSGSEYNARQIADRLADPPEGEAGPAVLVGYSKGANDILEFLVRYPDVAGRVVSMVSVAGAIGGSPLATRTAGVYDALLDRLPAERCPPGDGRIVDSLRSDVRQAWLASNPLPQSVRYYSLAAFTTPDRMARALYPAWKLLLGYDRRNDGQVLARDALIPGSTLLGYLNADHWSAAIDVEAVHPVLGARRDPVPFPREALLEAILLEVAEHQIPGSR